MGDKILAYDLGTGGAKASLYTADGECLASDFVPYDTFYPENGWHEQRPDDWWQAIVASTRHLLEGRPGDANAVESLAVSGQSLGVVPVDRKGRLLRERTPIWSDTRASRQAAAFFRSVDPVAWYMATGNGFPAECYSVFKTLWYRDREPEVIEQADKVIGSKDYINLKLTGRAATDPSYASGSGVYDLAGWRYRDDFIAASGLPRRLYPEIVPSTAILGTLTPQAAEQLGLPPSVKVACGGVDNSCMALGARNTCEGRVYLSLGSSAWIAVSSGKPVLDPATRPFVFAHVVPGLFTSAVSIFAAGSALRWIRDTIVDLGAGGADGQNAYEQMNEMAARSPLGARKLLFNPSLAGGTSQEASANVRGCFAGLDLRHTREDLVRAGMEGIAMNLRAVLDVLRGMTKLGREMLIVGGGARSRLWRQILADVFEMDIVKTSIDQDAGSLGAAALAAVGAGLWTGFDRVDAIHRKESVERPIAAHSAAYGKLRPAFDYLRRAQAALGDLLRDIDLDRA